jgi:23S rRNA (pseudouridine1915-N3)-methyltransferase
LQHDAAKAGFLSNHWPVKLRLIAVGGVREPYVAEAVADFRQRLQRMTPYEEREVAAASGRDPARAMREEAERVRRALGPNEIVWLLERTGRSFTSVELAERLAALELGGARRLTLVVAGAYGAAPSLIERADLCWSLSPLTFLHEWARAIAIEQLYRAMKIRRNEPYNH